MTQAAMAMQIQHDAGVYTRANKFLTALKKHRREITAQEYSTLRGQALAGDIDGATKGLDRILRRKE